MRKITGFAFGILLTLAGIEAGVRGLVFFSAPLRNIFYPRFSAERIDATQNLEELLDLSWLGFQPFLSYRGFVLNSKSFRTKEYTLQKAPHLKRILILGDSFGFASGGVPYREHWPRATELLLNGSNERVEVINLSVSSVGVPFYKRIWELEGSKLGADMVILNFFVGNDFHDHFQSAETKPISYLFGLGEKLKVLWEAEKTSPSGIRQKSYLKEAAGTELTGYVFTPGRMSERQYVKLKQEYRRLLNPEESQIPRSAPLVRKYLTELSQEISKSGAIFIVQVAPMSIQVDERASLLPPLQPDFPQRVMGEMLRSIDVEYIDLLPDFLLSHGESLYNERESHWNVAGNQLVAKWLSRRVEDKLFSQRLVERHL